MAHLHDMGKLHAIEKAGLNAKFMDPRHFARILVKGDPIPAPPPNKLPERLLKQEIRIKIQFYTTPKQKGMNNMKIVVIGGSGLIGSRVVKKLREEGHEAIAA